MGSLSSRKITSSQGEIYYVNDPLILLMMSSLCLSPIDSWMMIRGYCMKVFQINAIQSCTWMMRRINALLCSYLALRQWSLIHTGTPWRTVWDLSVPCCRSVSLRWSKWRSQESNPSMYVLSYPCMHDNAWFHAQCTRLMHEEAPIGLRGIPTYIQQVRIVFPSFLPSIHPSFTLLGGAHGDHSSLQSLWHFCDFRLSYPEFLTGYRRCSNEMRVSPWIPRDFRSWAPSPARGDNKQRCKKTAPAGEIWW